MYSDDVGSYEEISLVGFRLEVERERPEFYFLAFTGESAMLPLMKEGNIIMFSNKRHIPLVIRLAGSEELASGAQRNRMWFGVGRAMAYLENETVDNRACIIEAINLLDDLLLAVKVPRPSPHAEHLDQLADYLTFNRDLEAFFAAATFDRKAACDALRWCIGAVFSRMILLPHIIRS